MENEQIQQIYGLINAWHKTLNVPQLKPLNTMLMNELVEIQELYQNPAPPPDYPPPEPETTSDSSSIRRPIRNFVGGPAEDANQ